jgi:hypothetical protein
MRCPLCKHENPEDHHLCRRCGVNIYDSIQGDLERLYEKMMKGVEATYRDDPDQEARKAKNEFFVRKLLLRLFEFEELLGRYEGIPDKQFIQEFTKEIVRGKKGAVLSELLKRSNDFQPPK